MNLHEIVDHCAYEHRRLGPVWVVGRHPHDGAAIIVCYHNEEEDEEEFALATSEDFERLLTSDTYEPTHGRAQHHYEQAREKRRPGDCCDNMNRTMAGGCANCGDPCL